MKDSQRFSSERYTTSQLAAATRYSVQQIRDLERLDVIPPAQRQPNGYRQFTTVHVIALRAYRDLAVAVGPVVARGTMRELRDLPYDEAIARVVALHVDLARSRAEVLSALDALERIVDESAHESAAVAEDSMTITELSGALGVRASALRFWEQQGLLTPERSEHLARLYPPDAIRDARVVAALRAGGYRIPAVRAVIASLRALNETRSARDALQDRLRNITAQSEALLRAGTDITCLLSARRRADTPATTISGMTNEPIEACEERAARVFNRRMLS